MIQTSSIDRQFDHHPRPSARRRCKKGAEDQDLGRSRGGLSTKIHMAVRGLGYPVRFKLTAGQKGDAPQTGALIEGLSVDIVMADNAYDSDHLRDAIADKGAVAVIPNIPRVPKNTRWTRASMPSATSSNASPSSRTSAGSQRASKKSTKLSRSPHNRSNRPMGQVDVHTAT